MIEFITIVLPLNSELGIHGKCATRCVKAESPRAAAEKRFVGVNEGATVLVVDPDGSFTSAFKSVPVSRPTYEIAKA